MLLSLPTFNYRRDTLVAFHHAASAFAVSSSSTDTGTHHPKDAVGVHSPDSCPLIVAISSVANVLPGRKQAARVSLPENRQSRSRRPTAMPLVDHHRPERVTILSSAPHCRAAAGRLAQAPPYNRDVFGGDAAVAVSRMGKHGGFKRFSSHWVDGQA